MKKIISLVAIMSMLLAIIPAYAEDVVIDVENMISAGAENWGETAEDIEITDGILSVKSSIVSYKKEKYSDGRLIFSAKVGDNSQWTADKSSWFGIGLRQKTTNNEVWLGNEAAYLVVIKPHKIELQRWVGGSEFLVEMDTDIVSDTDWHDYEFQTLKTENGVRLSLAIDGKEVIDYLDDSVKKLTISGYVSFYNNTSDAQAGSFDVKGFESEMTDFDAISENEKSDETENTQAGATLPNNSANTDKAPEYKIYPADDVTILVSGEKLVADVAPVIVNDRVLVPFRAIFEKMNAEVEWVADTRKVIGKKGSYSVELMIDASTGIINGSFTSLDTPAIIVNDRTLVPVRVVAEGLNAVVDWDDATRTVIINNK